MRFLIDAQLPPALVGWFKARGHEAEHIADALGVTAKDQAIAAHARAIGAVVVTKDADFSALVEKAAAPQLLWVRLGNAINRVLFAKLDAEWAGAERELKAGRAIVEVGHDGD